MDIMVPMNPKNNKIHNGHKAIINYAKQFGNPVVVIHKENMHKNINLEKQVNSINDIGISVEIVELPIIDQIKKQKTQSIVNNIVNLYKDQLILPRYIKRITNSVINSHFTKGSKNQNISTVIYGPEPVHFFFKSIGNLKGIFKYIICPYMIKTKNSIRYQTLFSSLSQSEKNKIPAIRTILNKAKYLYKKGSNIKLVKELNNSYKEQLINIEDITVFEGGIFTGRIEVVGIHVHHEQGSTLLEEIDYYA